MILGLFAWRLYEVDGAERSLLRGAWASVFIGVTVYAVTFPSLPALFPSALVADDPRRGCAQRRSRPLPLPGAESRLPGWHRDALYRRRGAAEFLGQGPCRFALIDPRSERSFVQRANANGLRYGSANGWKATISASASR